MYGIELAPNTIVAAGSVVTKSFPEGNIVIGGNPAKVITTWEKFAEKNRDLAWDLSKYTREEEIRMHRDCIKLVKR